MSKKSHTKVVHFRKEPYDIYIGRPSKWGNPFTVEEYGRGGAINKFREWVAGQPELVKKIRRELTGRTLGCWCRPRDCHGDVYVEICDGKQGELF